MMNWRKRRRKRNKNFGRKVKACVHSFVLFILFSLYMLGRRYSSFCHFCSFVLLFFSGKYLLGCRYQSYFAILYSFHRIFCFLPFEFEFHFIFTFPYLIYNPIFTLSHYYTSLIHVCKCTHSSYSLYLLS